MAYIQMPELFIRGTIYTKTLKNLTQEQLIDLEKRIEDVVADPILNGCRYEFCNALARTIRNDYTDKEIAMQEFRIAIMRGVLAAVYGWGKNPPVPHIFLDSKSKKKWFQSWVFNYLRQILRENKLPTIVKTSKVNLSPEEAAIHSTKEVLRDVIKDEKDFIHRRELYKIIDNISIAKHDGIIDIDFNHWLFPSTMTTAIKELSDMYLKFGVRISYHQSGVRIEQVQPGPDIEITNEQSDYIKVASFDAADDENKQRLEAVMQNDTEVPVEETTTRLLQRIPIEAQPILRIYIEDTRPQDYLEKYGTGTPRISHMAEYLGMTPKEVKKYISIIKLQCMAVGLGY